MDQRFDWILRNSVLAVALYFTIVEHVGWLQYAITVFTWGMLGLSLWGVISVAKWRPMYCRVR